MITELVPATEPAPSSPCLLSRLKRIRKLCPDNTYYGDARLILQRDIWRYAQAPKHNIRVQLERMPPSILGLENGDMLDIVIGDLESSGSPKVPTKEQERQKENWKQVWTYATSRARQVLQTAGAHVMDFPAFRDNILAHPDLADWIPDALKKVCGASVTPESEYLRDLRTHVQSVRLFIDMFLAHFHTYIHDQRGQNKNPVGSDRVDIQHTVFSGFADYFVTEEKSERQGLRHRYDLIRQAPTDPECVSLKEFVQTLGKKRP